MIGPIYSGLQGGFFSKFKYKPEYFSCNKAKLAHISLYILKGISLKDGFRAYVQSVLLWFLDKTHCARLKGNDVEPFL